MFKSARKIGTTRGSVSGFFPFRSERSIAFESILERDFLVLRAFDPRVRGVWEQPCQIPFAGKNGQVYTYTPDFLVEFEPQANIRPHLVEVKPEAKWRAHWRRWLPKWKAARRYARDRGWIFHIADESRIRTLALSNIRRLEFFGRMRFPEVESDALIRIVCERSRLPAKEILEHYDTGRQPELVMAHLWYLVAHRRLYCDVEKLLGPDTTIWLPEDNDKGGGDGG